VIWAALPSGGKAFQWYQVTLQDVAGTFQAGEYLVNRTTWWETYQTGKHLPAKIAWQYLLPTADPVFTIY